jgi:hypothetical protein
MILFLNSRLGLAGLASGLRLGRLGLGLRLAALASGLPEVPPSLRRLGLGLGFPARVWARLHSFGSLVRRGEMSIFHMEDPVRIFVDARIMGDDQDAAVFR